jgi:mannose-6-phosphate isomerase-like protein (cupin superfamily)
MGHRAFLIAGSRAALIANDISDFGYLAVAHSLAVGAHAPIARRDCAETQFMVERGIIEFMIGGASGMALAGDFVRVPAGVAYAYRNAGETTARLLVRTVSPNAASRAIRITSSFAA